MVLRLNKGMKYIESTNRQELSFNTFDLHIIEMGVRIKGSVGPNCYSLQMASVFCVTTICRYSQTGSKDVYM